MRIFAIADLHLDFKKEKPMDIFGDNWENHEENILTNWENTVDKDDLVLVPGDISWKFLFRMLQVWQHPSKYMTYAAPCKKSILLLNGGCIFIIPEEWL
jgi:predicted phosphohydrolase